MTINSARSVVAGILAVAVLAPGAAFAKAGHMGATSSTKAATMKCPVCKMQMPGHATKAAPARVHVGSHYYYCCTECGYKGTAMASAGNMKGHMGSSSSHMGGMKGHMGNMKGHMGKM